MICKIHNIHKIFKIGRRGDAPFVFKKTASGRF